MKYLKWILRLLPAAILLFASYSKLSGTTEAVVMFEQLGVEPWGRFLTGAIELIAVVLLLIPGLSTFGGFLSFIIMIGALSSHALFLGISVNGDGGALFGMAIFVLICSGFLIWLDRVAFLNALKQSKTADTNSRP